jgi:hypothetical protein
MPCATPCRLRPDGRPVSKRSVLAKAVRGSLRIEGYVATEDDVLAAFDDEAPADADAETSAAIRGYQTAMSFGLSRRDDGYDATELMAMHFMMLRYAVAKSPGRYRKGPIYVRDAAGDIVYVQDEGGTTPALLSCGTPGRRSDPSGRPFTIRIRGCARN